MVAAKVVPDQRVWELVYKPSSGFGKMRLRKLERMLIGDEHSVNAAGRLFNSLLEAGKANEHHVGAMLKGACHSSDQMRRLLVVAKDVGDISPNVNMLTSLMMRLICCRDSGPGRINCISGDWCRQFDMSISLCIFNYEDLSAGSAK